MFLRPSNALNELVLYLLAVSIERFGMQLHAYCFLSNHVHLVLTDPLGVLPAFEQYFSSLLARSCNAMHGRWESFWAPGSYSAVTLETPSDVIDKMAYTLANPVSAGLVRRGAEWPGIRSSPESMSAPPIRVERPEQFFRPNGPMPAAAMLRVVPPQGTTCLAELRAQLRAEVTKLEDKAARELAAKGWGFLGARRVLAQRPFARPAGVEPRRGLKPRVGARDKWKRIEAIGRLQAFLCEYREAWLRFASGVRDVVFPHGTYWMRVAYGVQCAPAD